ncbi:type I secretion system permease/ATPase [Tropicimonas sp. TH_r6]|uniref:type I secretion system permease/ATPase n=1 Tax=Tropicimonas sp. TH_r6 TaxID=3082085 RepID=UPI002955B502|nr:type I secretion system permease/ATPase [Tropicimonas sp. TH_r6]MDV7145553.1 type I secretion system permease/ATPase [Tropicimonas sp. TH_r6]
MRTQDVETGLRELRAARSKSRGLFIAAFLFSVFVNLLMLTGPLYMLQVYDRVLGSRSEETLIALSALVAFLYLSMGILDFVRGRVMTRVGGRFQELLDGRIFAAMLRSESLHPSSKAAATGLRDLETIRRFFGSPALMAFFDLPWTPIFLAAIFIFHPWLGMLAVAGGGTLIVITALNQWRTRQPALEAAGLGREAERQSQQMREEAETIEALGMRGAGFARWQQARTQALEADISASDRAGAFRSATKALRLFLQSAMLGLGAYLVLQGELSAGAMIAASILLGRALAPVEQAIGQWDMFQRASRGWKTLAQLLSETPPEPRHMALPKPAARLQVEQITVLPPGEAQASLRMVSFELPPGKAMGVIGPSGSGKTTLARAITGVWRCAGGRIRLDGPALDQYDPDVLGQHIGYLPQRIRLFDGTIAENIARLAPQPDEAAVVEAAKKADAHDMIVNFPKGYDTPLKGTSSRLSGGQIQRIGLARALYGDPQILVLDEPNSNLDHSGSEALNRAIRTMKSEGRSVIIMAHRPAAIKECDLLLVVDGGVSRAFGPRDEVLRQTVENAEKLQTQAGKGEAQ